MKKGTHLSFIFLILATALCRAQAPAASSLAPVRIILVGDSTVAAKSGWGPGFCAVMTPQVSCLNRAIGGRSTSSYRAEGSWAKVMDELSHKAEFKTTYVLIQFGHNDQPGKPGRSTDLATEFPANLRHYVQEVKAAGAQPVLITSLTRRWVENGKVVNTLAPWAEAAKKVAADEKIPVLDLNGDSAAAVQKMGMMEANTLAAAPPPPEVMASLTGANSVEAPKNAPGKTGNSVGELEHHGHSDVPVFDYTHLGAKGATFFGHMVAGELWQAVPDLRAYIQKP